VIIQIRLSGVEQLIRRALLSAWIEISKIASVAATLFKILVNAELGKALLGQFCVS
jgi:hypothetical protein